jgi:uncharacterized membrane protein YdjX (TVP38/TMEM64 family)
MRVKQGAVLVSSSKNTLRYLALGLWLVLLASFWWYSHTQQIGPVALVEDWTRLVADHPWGVLVFFVLYLIRLLLLFPVTLLMVAAGFLYGPILGFGLGLVAMAGSAVLGYLMARFFFDEPPSAGDGGFSTRFRTRLQENAFETVLISRLLFLPGDLVNYASGYLRIDLWAFTFATILGGIPGLLATVLFGASFEGEFTAGPPDIDPRLLLASLGILVVSLGLSFYLRKRRSLKRD